MKYKIYWKVVALQNRFNTLCFIKKCELESRNLIRGLINDFGYRDHKRSLIYDVAKYLLRTWSENMMCLFTGENLCWCLFLIKL